jgi:TolB protein
VKEIFQVDRDGAGLVQLTRHGSLTLSPTVAPDGRLAYVTYKGGAPEIWGQRQKDGAHEKFYPSSGAGGMLSSPVWSPDGKRLAFVQGDRRGNSDIMVLDMATNRVRRLTDGNGINTEPSWNPNGNQIAFTSDREGGPQVFLMQDDGSNLRRLTGEGLYNASPAWSPNGAMVAYVSRFEGKFDLFVYKLGEGKAYQITTGVSTSESPTWSPDERRLVFTSNRFGSSQLFTTDLSGRQILRMMDLADCQSPRWIRGR